MAQGHAGYIVGEIVKEPRGFFQRVAQGFFDGFFYNVSPMSPRILCDPISGYFLKAITMYPPGESVNELRGTFKSNQHVPLGKVWKNCLKNHNVISMYPSVK